MGRVPTVLLAMGIAAGLVCLVVPLWDAPYFTAEPLKYEDISYVERGNPSETEQHLEWFRSKGLIPHPFPIAHVVVKNMEKPVSGQLAFSADDQARLVTLTRRYEEFILPFFRQHFAPTAWKQKALWERAGRRIIAEIPLSTVWRRYIPAFRYGITPEDARALAWQVTAEMAALKSMRDANMPATFSVEFQFRTPDDTYSGIHAVALKPGEVGVAKYPFYAIDTNDDQWSWEYEVCPDTKWVTRYKKVTLPKYLLVTLQTP